MTSAVASHIDAAIAELERAKALADRDPEFAIERLGEARLCIAAARVALLSKPRELTRLSRRAVA